MTYKHTYVWKEHPDLANDERTVTHMICEGAEGILEIQQDASADTFVGSVWRVVPSTYWEPEDYVPVLEQEFVSYDEARRFLEERDTVELEWALEQESRMADWEALEQAAAEAEADF